jgi:hypothetical protein
MEEFIDYVEEVEEKPLISEKEMEDERLLNREFQEESFISEDFVPPDWYLF